LEVLGDGHQAKSYMEVRDCARAMVHLVSSQNEAVNFFNLGSGDVCSVARIAEVVVEESGFPEVSIEYTGGSRGWAGDVAKASLAVEKLNATNFATNFDSEAAVRHTARALIQEIGLHEI
ncbi:MAG: UDP-glucose 4-epimerase, partial [Euryarchaeota archaeon]|nr:UDP-glucose 4-epimerase [Euryarchaeota archaeon]